MAKYFKVKTNYLKRLQVMRMVFQMFLKLGLFEAVDYVDAQETQ